MPRLDVRLVPRLLVIALAAAFAACATSPLPEASRAAATPRDTASFSPTAAPSQSIPVALATPATPGLSWTTAREVERPGDAFEGPSGGPSQPTGPGTAGHPGHFPGQAIVSDVVDAGDVLVAVGYVGLEDTWRAIAWTSTDGDVWRLHSVDDQAGSFAVRVAAGRGGRVVAVGRSASRPVAWTSTDGQHWDRTALPTGGAEWERATAIAPLPGGGFLAGGSAGPELGDRRVRMWRSADGAQWTADPDDPSFAGAEVTGVVARDDVEIAVGRVGTGQRSSGSAAWVRSRPNGTWSAASGDVAAGLVNGVADVDAGRLLAVGSDLDERAAMAWQSSDGRAWTIVPASDAFGFDGGKIRMTDVAATSEGWVAVGNTNPLQYGTATSWVSTDGATWLRAPAYPALEQGEMLAVAATHVGLVAVGSFGAPDNYIPTIWRGPIGP